MSHSSVVKLIGKVGENHDKEAIEWRDKLLSELEVNNTSLTLM